MSTQVGIGLWKRQGGGGSVLSTLLGGSDAAAWVVRTREAGGGLTDLMDGGKHLPLSGSPPLLDHTGADYFRFPGTSGNSLAVSGLSVSTAYDYTVTYRDDSTATGGETTDGSGVLILGGTQTNFDAVDVKSIVIVPDGGGATVEEILATDAAESDTSFSGTEGLTITVNRTTTGLKLEVVKASRYACYPGNFLALSDDPFFDVGASNSLTMAVLEVRHHGGAGALIGRAANSFADGPSLSITTGTTTKYRVDDGPNTAQGTTTTTVDGNPYLRSLRLDRADDTLRMFQDGEQKGSAIDAASVGAMAPPAGLWVMSDGIYQSSALLVGAFFVKKALSTAELAAMKAELQRLNGG